MLNLEDDFLYEKPQVDDYLAVIPLYVTITLPKKLESIKQVILDLNSEKVEMELKECLLIPNELYWDELGQPPEYG